MWIKEETLKKVDELKELISKLDNQRIDFCDEDVEDWKECDPYLSRIDLDLIGDEKIEYDFLNVVDRVELTGFEDEDNPVLTKLDEKLKEV